MGHSAGFSHALGAIMQYLVMRYGQWGKICLYAMGCSAGFGYALRVIARNQLPDRRSTQQFFESSSYPLKGLL
jgi:hypothetical protein